MAAIRIVMGVFVPWQIDPSVEARGIGLADITRRYQQHQEYMVVNRIDEQKKFIKNKLPNPFSGDSLDILCGMISASQFFNLPFYNQLHLQVQLSIRSLRVIAL